MINSGIGLKGPGKYSGNIPDIMPHLESYSGYSGNVPVGKKLRKHFEDAILAVPLALRQFFFLKYFAIPNKDGMFNYIFFDTFEAAYAIQDMYFLTTQISRTLLHIIIFQPAPDACGEKHQNEMGGKRRREKSKGMLIERMQHFYGPQKITLALGAMPSFWIYWLCTSG